MRTLNAKVSIDEVRKMFFNMAPLKASRVDSYEILSIVVGGGGEQCVQSCSNYLQGVSDWSKTQEDSICVDS